MKFPTRKEIGAMFAAGMLGAAAGEFSKKNDNVGKSEAQTTEHVEDAPPAENKELSPNVKKKLEEYRLLIEEETPGQGETMVNALKGFLGNKNEEAQLELIEGWMKGPTISDPDKK